ncbi:MAG: DUF4199 domain-containing protein [Chitinophagaceae bacterium]|nr:DUF4199 domain-containing protein [Chitinophagaceae bacterium]
MKVNIINEGVKYGSICGMLALLVMYGSWTMGLQTFVSVQFISTFIPYMIAILLIAGLQIRKQNGGFLPFPEAMKFTFLSYVIAAIILAIGNYILFNLIDKDLTIKSFQVGLEKTRKMMENMGASPEQIQKSITDAEAKKQSTGIGQILLGTGLGLIWDFVKALLISICIKKEEKFDM